jgi:thiamine kinase-like enzyme
VAARATPRGDSRPRPGRPAVAQCYLLVGVRLLTPSESGTAPQTLGGAIQPGLGNREYTTMDRVNISITDRITKQLSELLGLDISYIQFENQVEDSSEIVRMVSIFDSVPTKHRFVLKGQEDQLALCLYTHYLKTFDLNSPKHYGYIDFNGQPLLVMDYVHHKTPNWSDSDDYVKAVEWLIKKDLVTSQHLDSIKDLECFQKMKYYGVQYWLTELERWAQNPLSNAQDRHVWRTVQANQSRIDTYIGELSSLGVQTVVHGDLHLSNVLFGDNENGNQIFVIDWTEPHVGSVTKDLASLYDNAPSSIKETLIHMYRKQIDFPAFDEMFGKAKLLRDIGYLSWMVEMIRIQGQEALDRNELDRVMQSIMRFLE